MLCDIMPYDIVFYHKLLYDILLCDTPLYDREDSFSDRYENTGR